MAKTAQISLFGFEEEVPAPQAPEPKAPESAVQQPASPPAETEAPANQNSPEAAPAVVDETPATIEAQDLIEITSFEISEEVAEPEPPAPVDFIDQEDAPIVVVLRDESTVAFEGPKKRGRKKRDKKWTTDTPGKRGRKSLSDAAAMADLVEIPSDEILFQKQYYSMGEVCDMFRMNPSHVRIWSREFESHLQLKKNKKGDRFFRPDDVKTLHFIHHLIRERKYTINGAREFLKQQQKGAKVFDLLQSLEKIKSFLLELKAGL